MGMISVSYDDWEYPLDTRVRDGVGIISSAATAMLREKGEVPEAQSSCYSTASDRSPGKLPPSALRRCVCVLGHVQVPAQVFRRCFMRHFFFPF